VKHDPAREQTEAGDKTECHPELRRNQVVVKGILDGECDAEKERQPGCIGKPLYAEELFPIDGRTGWTLRLRDGF